MTKSLIDSYPYNVINYPSNAYSMELLEDSISFNQMGIDTIVQVANYQTVVKLVERMGLELESINHGHKLYKKLLEERAKDSKKRLLDEDYPLMVEVIRLPKVDPNDKSLYISIVRNIPSLFDVATHHKKAKDSFCMVTFAGLHQPTKKIDSEAMKIISRFLKRKTFKLQRVDIAIDTKDSKPINYGRRAEFKSDLSPFSKHGVKLDRNSFYINKIDHETISRLNYYDKFQKQQYYQGKEKIGRELKDWKRLEFTLTFDVTKSHNKGFIDYMESANLINHLETIDEVARLAEVKNYDNDYLIYQLNSIKDNRFMNNSKSKEQFNSLESLNRFKNSDCRGFRLDLLENKRLSEQYSNKYGFEIVFE